MSDTERYVLDVLDERQAVLTGRHFIFTKGGHGTAYIDMRMIAHETPVLRRVGGYLADTIAPYQPDVVIGPETLGRTLAGYADRGTRLECVIWCSMVGEGEDKKAVFSPKLPFVKQVYGKRVAIVDDLLTTGSSMRAVAKLIRLHGGEPVVAAAAVRRTPDVAAEDCGVENLCVLADVPGFVVYTPQQCAEIGPCAAEVPVVLRPGHGHEWIKFHPDYPTE